jgi:hypothetical protein
MLRLEDDAFGLCCRDSQPRYHHNRVRWVGYEPVAESGNAEAGQSIGIIQSH